MHDLNEAANNRGFSIRSLIQAIGVPTIIIASLWTITLILGTMYGLGLTVMLTDTIRRFGMNAVLVLAMVPAIQSGTGPNFALPIGIVCGLLAMVLCIEMGLESWNWLLCSGALAIVFAIILGIIYGKLMNAVKGSEMTIATYTGYSITAIMCLVWLMVPFKNPKMGWFIGKGLRETIQLDTIKAAQILNSGSYTSGAFSITRLFASDSFAGIPVPMGVTIFKIYFPLGMIAVFLLLCFLMWLFFRSRTGIAVIAVGQNPSFARANGLNIDKSRTIANVLSTVLAALGIIIYSQSFGFMQLYTAPQNMTFTTVAAVLIGGATAQRAKISHVVIGTILFQGLLATALPVANKIFQGTDLSEMLRSVIQNGIILFALTQVKGGGSDA